MEVLPPAWYYTEDAVARITFKDKSYTSQNFKETQWKLATDVIVNNAKHGSIEVYYLNEKPALHEGPFLKEERSLIDSLSQLLGRAIENIQKSEEILNANQQLKASEQQLIAANQQLIAGEQQLRAANQELMASEGKLKISEYRYRSLVDNSPVSLWEEDWIDVIEMVEEIQNRGITNFESFFNSNPDFVDEALSKVKILDVNTETLHMFKAKSKTEMLKSLSVVFGTADILPGFIGELIALAKGDSLYETEMKLCTVKEKLLLPFCE